jgi:hypothetical protein
MARTGRRAPRSAGQVGHRLLVNRHSQNRLTVIAAGKAALKNLPVGEQHQHLAAAGPGHGQVFQFLVFEDLAKHYLNSGAGARAVHQGKRQR